MISSATSSALLIGRRVHVAAKRLRTSTAAAARPSPSFEYKVQSTDDPKPRKTCITCGFVNCESSSSKLLLYLVNVLWKETY